MMRSRLLSRQGIIEAVVCFLLWRSLTYATLRLTNRSYHSEYEGHFEIVSLTGKVARYGSHLDISISNGEGKTLGGHLVSRCKIYTTAAMVIAAFEDVVY